MLLTTHSPLSLSPVSLLWVASWSIPFLRSLCSNPHCPPAPPPSPSVLSWPQSLPQPHCYHNHGPSFCSPTCSSSQYFQPAHCPHLTSYPWLPPHPYPVIVGGIRVLITGDDLGGHPVGGPDEGVPPAHRAVQLCAHPKIHWEGRVRGHDGTLHLRPTRGCPVRAPPGHLFTPSTTIPKALT